MVSHVCTLSSASACFECFGARGFAFGLGDEGSLDFERGDRVVRGRLGDGDRESDEWEGGGDSERGREALVDGERERGVRCGGDEGRTTNSSRSAGIDMCFLQT